MTLKTAAAGGKDAGGVVVREKNGDAHRYPDEDGPYIRFGVQLGTNNTIEK